MSNIFSQTNLGGVAVALSLICINAAAATKPSAPASAPAKPAATSKPAANSKPTPTGASKGTPAANALHGATTTAGGVKAGGIKPSGIITGSATAHRTPAATHPNPVGQAGSGHQTPHGISSRAPAGSTTTHAANGAEIRTRANGQLSDVHDVRRGMDIHNGLSGNRTSRVDRDDHSRLVTERGRGYAQRQYAFRGHEYGHRTYYAHGRAYDRYYRSYMYRGVPLDIYAPGWYYPAGFYGWAYNPWFAPVTYDWGFGTSPWYGYYGGYFAPQPAYPSASSWLADYIIGSSLATSYQARVDAGQPLQPLAAAGQPALSPEISAEVSAEVQRQIALENQEAQTTAQNQEVSPQSSGIARMLGDGTSHVFVVGHDLDVTDVGGRECVVTAGDVLQLRTAQPAGGGTANLIVVASKGGQECGQASTVVIGLSDLQDMQNHMRETIDQGLRALQAKQGQGGLPAEPAGATGGLTAAPFTRGAPPAEANIAAEVAHQSQEADKAVAEAGQPAQFASGPNGSEAAPPKEVSLGMSQDDVIGILGTPKSIVNGGPAKTMLLYSDMKLTLKAGKVVEIQ